MDKERDLGGAFIAGHGIKGLFRRGLIRGIYGAQGQVKSAVCSGVGHLPLAFIGAGTGSGGKNPGQSHGKTGAEEKGKERGQSQHPAAPVFPAAQGRHGQRLGRKNFLGTMRAERSFVGKGSAAVGTGFGRAGTHRASVSRRTFLYRRWGFTCVYFSTTRPR